MVDDCLVMGKGIRPGWPGARRFRARSRRSRPEPALHHHDGVHGAGARTSNRFDGQAPVFKEGVEHAPRECAVGTAALQGERHGLLGAARRGRRSRPDGVKRGRSSRRPAGTPVMNHALVTGATASPTRLASAHIPPGERSAILPARWNARHAKRPSQISRRNSIGYTGTCVRCRPLRHSDLYGYQGTVNGIAAHSVSSLDSAMGSAVHTTFRAPAGDSSAQPRGRLVTGGGTDATLKWLHHNVFRIHRSRYRLRPLKSAPRPIA